MPNIKDVLYVRFRVTDLQAQKQFLEDFGLQTKLEGDLFNESFGSHKRSPADLLGTHWWPEGMPGQ